MANEKVTKKSELEIEALELYIQAMKIWISQNGGGIKAQDSGSNPPTPPPHP